MFGSTSRLSIAQNCRRAVVTSVRKEGHVAKSRGLAAVAESNRAPQQQPPASINLRYQNLNVFTFKEELDKLFAKQNLMHNRFPRKSLPVDTLDLLLQSINQGLTPNLDIYHSIMKIFASFGWRREILALIVDAQALGIQPTLQTYNYLVQASCTTTDEMLDAVARLRNAGFQPDSTTYLYEIKYYAAAENLEMCLHCLEEMYVQNLKVERHTIQTIVQVAADLGLPRLGLDIAKRFEATTYKNLNRVTWLALLTGSADSHYVEGALECWRKLENSFLPDEGLCMRILHVAARHGLPNLAVDIHKALGKHGINLQEHHLAPLFEAFVAAGNVKASFGVLTQMRKEGIVPTLKTTSPLFKALSVSVEEVDEAFSTLEELQREGQVIDTTAFNVVLQACVALGDLTRVMGTFKESTSLGVEVSIDTYNLLLSACIEARHKELGQRMYEELKASRLRPNFQTYERMIILSLTQDIYEDAFVYLEEMKSQNHKPPAEIYTALIRKCVSNLDTRWKVALEEMKEQGYQPSQKLLKQLRDL